jgi:predicted dehydrogenase
LGFWQRGGGAAGEHSHALHLWQLFAKQAGLGEPVSMSSAMEIKKANGAEYDSLAAFLFQTNHNKVGRVIQDVITSPTRKWVRLQGEKGFIEWIANSDPKGDVVKIGTSGREVIIKVFEKKRPDDFLEEMLHIVDLLEKRVLEEDSPLSLASAVKVMKIISLAHANRNQTVNL